MNYRLKQWIWQGIRTVMAIVKGTAVGILYTISMVALIAMIASPFIVRTIYYPNHILDVVAAIYGLCILGVGLWFLSVLCSFIWDFDFKLPLHVDIAGVFFVPITITTVVVGVMMFGAGISCGFSDISIHYPGQAPLTSIVNIFDEMSRNLCHTTTDMSIGIMWAMAILAVLAFGDYQKWQYRKSIVAIVGIAALGIISTLTAFEAVFFVTAAVSFAGIIVGVAFMLLECGKVVLKNVGEFLEWVSRPARWLISYLWKKPLVITLATW